MVSEKLEGMRVGFVVGLESQSEPSFRYRCLNQKEMLDLCGAETSIQMKNRDFKIEIDSNLLIVHRYLWDESLKNIYQVAKARKVPIVCDVDDLFFSMEKIPEEILNVGLSQRSIYQMRTKPEYCRDVWRAIANADLISVSTEYLKSEIAQKLNSKNVPIIISPNCLSVEQVRHFERFLLSRNESNKTVVVGYSGGTRYHHKIFEAIEEVLAALLRQNCNVRLCYIGIKKPQKLVSEFPGRIDLFEKVEYERYPELISRFDVNLAPLIDNPFCRSKSELKYIEAGLLGIPTVASNLGGYQSSLRNGVNGYVCEKSSEWLAVLENLVRDRDLRIRIGKAAREDVLKNYTTINQAQKYVEKISKQIQLKKGRSPKVTVQNWDALLYVDSNQFLSFFYKVFLFLCLFIKNMFAFSGKGKAS